MERFNRIKKFIKLFILFNVLIFALVIATNSIGRPYPIAKVYLSSATTVFYVYIVPSTKIFGPYNILSKPFFPVVNFLYENGMKYLPDNDAERQIWWSRIRFNEFYHCVQPTLLDYIGRRIDASKVNPEEYLRWTDEIYSHLEPMAKLSIKDPVFKGLRFKTYNDIAWSYTRARGSLIYRIYSPINSKKYPYNEAFVNNEKEINKLENVLDWYLALKENPENNKQVKSLLKSAKWHLDYILIERLTIEILASKIIHNEFKCNNLVRLNLQARDILVNKAPNDSRIPKYHKYRINLALNSGLNKFVMQTIDITCN